MDSTGLMGVYIQWLKPIAEIDFNNVKSSDWQRIAEFGCMVMDGSYFDVGEGYAWMPREQGECPIDYDSRIFVLVSDTQPTNTPHSVWPNYKRMYTKYSLERRTDAEIIESIIQEEKMANNQLDLQADSETMNTFVLGYLVSKANGIPVTEAQVNAYNRQGDVQFKKAQNAGTRIEMIRQIGLGNYNIDISLGWERNDIAVGGFPFSN